MLHSCARKRTAQLLAARTLYHSPPVPVRDPGRTQYARSRHDVAIRAAADQGDRLALVQTRHVFERIKSHEQRRIDIVDLAAHRVVTVLDQRWISAEVRELVTRLGTSGAYEARIRELRMVALA